MVESMKFHISNPVNGNIYYLLTRASGEQILTCFRESIISNKDFLFYRCTWKGAPIKNMELPKIKIQLCGGWRDLDKKLNEFLIKRNEKNVNNSRYAKR